MKKLGPVALLVLGLITVSPCSGQMVIAYPWDGAWTGSGNLIPFGDVGPAHNFAEARSHHLIPATFLPPTGGKIIGLEVYSHTTVTVDYKRLVINMGHTLLTSLSTTFVNNIPTPLQTVVNIGPSALAPWKSFQWYRYDMSSSPFTYDGRNNLFIEVIKEVSTLTGSTIATSETSNRPARGDLPRPVWASSGKGGGGTTKTTGTLYSYPVHMRVIFAVPPTPTLTIDGVRGGSSSNLWALGTPITWTTHSNPKDNYWLMFDVALANRPLSIPPIGGVYRLILPFKTLWVGRIGTSGSAPFKLTVPNVSALVGTKLYAQSGVYNDLLTFLAWTNVVDCIIQS
jgi:hypothetical protein